MRFVISFAFILLTRIAYAETLYLECSYTSLANDQLRIQKSDFELQFLIDNNNAYMIGNAGSVEVLHYFSNQGLFIIEQTPSGNLTTTTINLTEFSTVHSRHIIIGSELVASQFYGSCKIR